MSKMRLSVLAVLVGVLALAAGAETKSGARNILLLDAPGGHEIGWIRDPDRLEVLEQRGGWKRVRLDGWISENPGASIRGRTGDSPGLDVILLPGGQALADTRRAAEETAREEIGGLAEEVETLAADRSRALRISNFSEATQRYDELDAIYKSRLEELRAVRYRVVADLVDRLAPAALMTGTSGVDGTFELHAPGAGTYGVFLAAPDAEDFPCCWVEVTLDDEDVWVELDPKKGKTKVRRSAGN